MKNVCRRSSNTHRISDNKPGGNTLPQKGISIVKVLEDLNQHKMLQFSLKYFKKSTFNGTKIITYKDQTQIKKMGAWAKM